MRSDQGLCLQSFIEMDINIKFTRRELFALISFKIEAMYEHAIRLQAKAVEEVRQDEGLLIPADIDYSS